MQPWCFWWLRWNVAQKKFVVKILNFFSHTEVLVAYLLLWSYVTVASVDFMILQKMYIVMNKSRFCQNWMKTHFSPKRFCKFLRNLDMLYSALYLIFLLIFKLLAWAVILLDTCLVLITRYWVKNEPKGTHFTAKCVSCSCRLGVDWNHMTPCGTSLAVHRAVLE